MILVKKIDIKTGIQIGEIEKFQCSLNTIYKFFKNENINNGKVKYTFTDEDTNKTTTLKIGSKIKRNK